MSLSKEEVRRIAELARIGISDAEARAVQAQLNDIFELIGQMQRVDTDGIEPMSHGQDLKLRLREDVVEKRDGHKERELFQLAARRRMRASTSFPR